MTHLKKSLFIVYLCSLFTTLLPMYKTTIHKNIAPQSKQSFNVLNKRTLKHATRKKFQSEKLKTHVMTHHKKYIGLAVTTGILGYGIYNPNSVQSLIKYIKDKPADRLKNKDLIQYYVADYKNNLVERNFEKASDNEKDMMIHAIMQCLHEGNYTSDFALIPLYLNDQQKKTFYTLYSHLLKERFGDHVLTAALYSRANQHGKKALLKAIVPIITNAQTLDADFIQAILHYSNKEERTLLDTAIAQRLGFDKLALSNTQSGALLSRNISTFYTHNFNKFIEKKLTPEEIQYFKNIMAQILENEIAYSKKKYDILLHGQTRKGAWNQALYTELYRRKYKKELNNYYFMRFMHDSTCQKNANTLYQGKITRQKLLKEGGFENYEDLSSGRKNGNELMFTNYGLSTYAAFPGRSSLFYFTRNFNQKPSTITNKEIFALFGQEAFYAKNKDRIDALEQQFIKLSQQGSILQIAFPPGYLEKYVYVAEYNGSKREIHLNHNGITKKVTIKYLFDSIKKNTQEFRSPDEMEFIFIVTPDAVQKLGYKGVEIKTYSTADPQKTEEIFNTLRTTISPLWSGTELFETPYECYKKHYKN